MNQDPFGNQQYQQQPRRRGFQPAPADPGAVRGYAAYYYFSNRSTDPLTGETVLTIDKSISPDDEGDGPAGRSRKSCNRSIPSIRTPRWSPSRSAASPSA